MLRTRRGLGRALAILLCLGLVAAACGDDDEPTGGQATTTTAAPDGGGEEEPTGATDVGVTEDTIRVSQIVSLSGVNMAGQAGFEKGFEAYVEYLNDQGGVHDRMIEIVDTYDDTSEPARNGDLFRQTENGDDVFAVVGSWPSFGGAEFAIENNIPVIGAPYSLEWSMSDTFFGVPGGSWKAPDPNDLPQVPAAPYDNYIMAKQGDTKMGTFGYTQAASASAAVNSCNRVNDFNDIGQECVYTDTSLEFGFTDLGASIAQIQASGATHFYAGMDIGGCVTLLRGFLRAGMNDATLRCAVGYGQDTLENFGDVIDGRLSIVLGSQPFDSDHPEIQLFVEELTSRMPGEEPSTTILNGWLAGMFLHDVLEELGTNVTRERFIETARSAEPFKAWNGRGITGAVDYTVNRHEAVLDGTYAPDPELCSGILLKPDVANLEWVQVGQKPALCLAGLSTGAELLERIEDDDSSLEIEDQ